MAARQRLSFVAITAAPERAHGVNYMPRGQLATARRNRLPCGKPADARDDSFALFENSRATGTMNCAIHPTAAQQRRVGRIHDSVRLLARDVARAGDDQRTL